MTRCVRQTQQTARCRGDAHVVLLQAADLQAASTLPSRTAARHLRSAQPPKQSAATNRLLRQRGRRQHHHQPARRPTLPVVAAACPASRPLTTTARVQARLEPVSVMPLLAARRA
jgi:hypothetical protein